MVPGGPEAVFVDIEGARKHLGRGQNSSRHLAVAKRGGRAGRGKPRPTDCEQGWTLPPSTNLKCKELILRRTIAGERWFETVVLQTIFFENRRAMWTMHPTIKTACVLTP